MTDDGRELGVIVDGYGVRFKSGGFGRPRSFQVYSNGDVFAWMSEYKAWQLCRRLRTAHRQGEAKGRKEENDRVARVLYSQADNAKRSGFHDEAGHLLAAVVMIEPNPDAPPPGVGEKPTPCGSLPRIGDEGQRYEVRCIDETAEEIVLGWSETYPHQWLKAVEASPGWSHGRVIDRRAEGGGG